MTKRFRFLLPLCLALGISAAQGDMLTPGADTRSILGRVDVLETKDGFSAQFWMTSEDQIFSTWTTAGAIRNLKPTISVKRHVPVYLALFLANPGVKEGPSAAVGPTSNVTCDLYVVNPNGALCLADRQRSAWRGASPSPGLVVLAKDRGILSFEAIDPLGDYTIVVVVHDNIRKVDIKLMRKLRLTD